MKNLYVSFLITVTGIVILEASEIPLQSTTFDVHPDKITEQYKFRKQPLESDPHYLTTVEGYKQIGGREVLQATLVNKPTFVTTSNGFVDAVVTAYKRHHNLIIRPDDVWLAIVLQFSNFVNANAEKLRGKFVAHGGKKKLEIHDIGRLRNIDYGKLARNMAKLMRQHLKEPKLYEWIRPDFSTTTDNDRIVGSVAMMTAMQKYFAYEFVLSCGIPKVTVLGTTEDWKNIQQRVKQLAEYGPECKKWSQMLGKILDEFVRAVSHPKHVNVDFWQKICHFTAGGSGPSYVSGWISAFAVFNEKGVWQGDITSIPEDQGIIPEYPVIDADNIPSGYSTVEVIVDDNGTKHNCAMFVGHTGYNVTKDGTTLAPQLTWGIVLKAPEPARPVQRYG